MAHNSGSLVRLTGILAVPALLQVVVKPVHATLSRQRSRIPWVPGLPKGIAEWNPDNDRWELYRCTRSHERAPWIKH